jgi:hypothetical protein
MESSMPSVVRLRVTAPFLTVTSTNSSFVTLPEGTVIETSDDLTKPGFHPVKRDDQDLLAFTRDIRERTEPAEERNF